MIKLVLSVLAVLTLSSPIQDHPITKSLPKQDHSVTNAQKMLAKLNYLPLTQELKWKYKVPASLQSLWKVGRYNVMTKGAVMQFQHENGLPTDGVLGTQTWNKLYYDYQHNKVNPRGYTYVEVSEKLPEILNLWSNGLPVISTVANTGVKGCETPLGTYPVYLRYKSQTMQGTNPDGSHYDDPNIPNVNYFDGGCAIHGFPRARYGYPQSLGCVELPKHSSDVVWNYIDYGSLVTITK